MPTFADDAGRSCRASNVSRNLPDPLVFGIACRAQDADWQAEIIVCAPMIERRETGVVPVPGPGPGPGPGADALAAMIDVPDGGETMAPRLEAKAIESGWRP